jgi:hypothetical protein
MCTLNEDFHLLKMGMIQKSNPRQPNKVIFECESLEDAANALVVHANYEES